MAHPANEKSLGNKIVYIVEVDHSSIPLDTATYQLWSANADGTNQQQIPVVFPTGVAPVALTVTPDGATVVLATVGGYSQIFTCSINGGNFTSVVTLAGNQMVTSVAAY